MSPRAGAGWCAEHLLPLQEWAAGARQREAEAAERKRLRELEKQAVREARKQVPVPARTRPRAVLRHARLFSLWL